jgi:tetratricopeptide (TPR) repeat protein
MSNELINNLLDALNLSPDNVPLRLQVADLMLKEKMYAESAAQYQQILEKSYGNTKAQLGLATCYFYLQKNSAAIIIYEQLQQFLSLDDQVRYIKCLIRENSIQQAINLYQQLIVLHPEFKDDEIDAQLRMPSAAADSDDDWNEDEDYFMEKPSIKFEDVGGMKRIKEEISIKIIQPLQNPDLYKAFGKKIGGGILLYGPPGCGKTFIAKQQQGDQCKIHQYWLARYTGYVDGE